MNVVQQQHERHRARAERRRQPWRRTAQHRYADPPHLDAQIRTPRVDPGVRRRQQDQQGHRVVVEPVKRHARNPTILTLRPLRQQGRLAVTRRRRDPHDATATRPSPLDQVDTADGPAPKPRHPQLGVQQQLAEIGSRRRETQTLRLTDPTRLGQRRRHGLHSLARVSLERPTDATQTRSRQLPRSLLKLQSCAQAHPNGRWFDLRQHRVHHTFASISPDEDVAVERIRC